MLLRLAPSDGPLHERIAAAVRRHVAEGEIAAGDRLPATRDLAAQLDVNVNTVLRAYRQLRDEGLVDLRRGRGATVIGSVDDAELTRDVDRLLATARRHGVGLDHVVRLLEDRA